VQAPLAATSVCLVQRLDVRLCFFGDSFTAGVGDETTRGWVGRVCARAGEAGHDLTVYNLGVRRETSRQVAERLRREAVPRLADGDRRGVVLAVGVNDTTIVNDSRRLDVEDTLAALDKFLRESSEAGWSVLVLGPAFVGDAHQNRRIEALSGSIRERCAYLDIPFVDVVSSLGEGEDWVRQVNAVDGAHPTASGYQQLADTIWPPFAAWLQRIENDA
jgi:acyl-CoA thioesterase-1